MLSEIKYFVNWLRRRNPEGRTWRDYGYDLAQFAASVGERPPGAITFQDIDHFIIQQVTRGMQPATVNRRMAAIAALYTFLADDDRGLVSPILPHRHYLRQRQRLPRPVPEEDLRKFFAVILDARDRAMFLLMLRCGACTTKSPQKTYRSTIYSSKPSTSSTVWTNNSGDPSGWASRLS